MKLILSSENFSNIPYIFSATNIRVYSIEEAIWHIFNYLKESLEIFDDDSFLNWLRDKLGLYEEAKILEGDSDDGNEKKLIDFLRKFSYLNEYEIEEVKKKFSEFSNLGEYEKNKEKGDKLYRAGKYQKAVYAYSNALKFDINKESVIKNNIGLCCMQCGDYENAASFFEQAYSIDKNPIILLNYVECCIFLNYIDRAEYLLGLYDGNDSFSMLYLKGLIALKKREYKKSIETLKLAIDIKKDASAILKISDIFIKQRQFENAVKFLEECKISSPVIFKRLSEIYCAQRNYSSAIATIQKGLIYF